MYYSSVNLTKYNTLAIPAIARWFLTVDSLTKLTEAVEFASDNELELTCLGEGSNVVFKDNHNGLILLNSLLGKEVVEEDDDKVIIDVWSGENWHKLVTYTIKHGWYGLENLALIPGTVGGAPIQNIGAYGVELNEVLLEVEFFDFNTKKIVTFTNEQCEFSYRNSIFKREMLNQIFITKIKLQLHKDSSKINCEYPGLIHYMRHHRMEQTPQCIYQTVCAIRKSKLPDLTQFPNAGSFFINPIIDKKQLKQLQTKLPDVPFDKVDAKTVKVKAAYLIEQAGKKGYRKNGIGIHYNQALIVTNVNRATGAEVLEFADNIMKLIKELYNIELTVEPQIYPRLDNISKPLKRAINST